MKFGIIIPAHNEELFLEQTLNSLVNQSLKPYQIIVVDDNSTDKTALILEKFTKEHSFIQKIYLNSEAIRLPGAKVVQAFNEGLKLLDSSVEIICKFDADLIFPPNYLLKVSEYYEKNPKTGMCGGFCSIENSGKWEIENLTNNDHLRGPIKSYRKACFEAIGGLKTAMGWDTADELLARYHSWEVKTDKTLIVKHLRPTGNAYNPKAQYLQGGMFYTLRYGVWLTLIASVKLAFRKRKFYLFKEYLQGYFKAKKEEKPFLVSEKEGKWIRKYRWKGIFRKIIHL